MTLGQRLTQLRAGMGLSQDALAEQLGVSRQSVSKWETDASVPELDKLVRLSRIFGVTLDELVKGTADAGAGAPSGPEAGSQAGTTGTESAPSDHGAAEEVLRLHRQKLMGIALMAVALLATALNMALVFLTVPIFVAGVLCLVVRRRLGLAIGWTLWICALFVTRYASAISMSKLLSPGYWQYTSLAAPLLALVQLAVLVGLAWRTLRNPPGLGACWGIWAGLLAALWLPVVRIFSMPLLQPTSVGEVLINFFPLLFPYYYRNAPLGAVLWWCYVLSTVWLIRRTLRPAKRGGNGTSQEC
ncbi:helix-turn-helix domain-containing protein [uncultured Oscillibacter sp.]|uniref:helix-turn-helix domain-containing protein n=1 Tax=uncultured Oscillibacter sp. TaxID=876091 RepID=UPI0025F33853|nr:helix-turn-helix transcriptional regulator [uncultured Oscillibacter sp.]